jgi:hypothetical protein
MKAQWELHRIEWSTPRPGRFTYGYKTRHPFYGMLDGPQGQVLTVVENLVPTGIQYEDRPILDTPAQSLEQQVVEISLTNCADRYTVQ